MAIFKSRFFITALVAILIFHSADAVFKNKFGKRSLGDTNVEGGSDLVGGVYAMSNDLEENTMVVYGRRANGTLVLLNRALKTGGQGALLNLGATFDPFFSAFSVLLTDDKRFVLAVNAGSNSVSVFRVLRDFSLKLVHVRSVPGFGPVSIAQTKGLVYVASVDADGEFDSVPSQQGLLSGFKLLRSGHLIPIPRSTRRLTFRPSAIKFSPDRRSLVVSDLFAGANVLSSGRLEEIVVFRVSHKGFLSRRPMAGVTSTELNNPEGRNLPGAIGFDIVVEDGVQYVVVPEVRTVALSDGMPANSETGQGGSVSTWRLDRQGRLYPVQLDVPVEGQVDSCWIQFSADLSNFWVVNTPSSSISAFSFSAGISTLESAVAATGEAPIDISSSEDGKFIYQLFSGSVGAFEVENEGRGTGLTLIQNPTNVPITPQGIVAI